MPKAHIERHPDVIEDDLPGIYSHIAVDDRAAAERLLRAINDTFDLLAKEPACGVLYRARRTKLQGTRMIPVLGFPNYLVFYRVDPECVRILYVVHGARHLMRLFRREPRK